MSEKHKYGSHFWLAVILIGVGVLLLMDNLGIRLVSNIWHFWPLILIIIGLSKLKTQHPAEKSSAYTLLFLGGIFLLVQLGVLKWRLIWQFWPVVLILFGLSLIYRKRRTDQYEDDDYSDETIDAVAFFGGCERKISAKNFRGGHTSAMFGGVTLDFREAKLASGEASINVFTMFGGTELRVPQDWQVVMKGFPIFGGFEDSRPHPSESMTGRNQTLVIKGFVMFGGIEIKNA
jgi:predicted membrane protein